MPITTGDNGALVAAILTQSEMLLVAQGINDVQARQRVTKAYGEYHAIVTGIKDDGSPSFFEIGGG